MDYLTLDERWNGRRGKGRPSRLLDNEGMMCCMGFYAKYILEAHDEEIRGLAYISETDRPPPQSFIQQVELEKLEDLLSADVFEYVNKKYYSYIFMQLERIVATINDAPPLSVEEKVEAINALFQKYLNCKVEYQNDEATV